MEISVHLLIGSLFFVNLLFIIVFSSLDARKKRFIKKKPFISCIVPSYNDAIFIPETVKSIFNSYKNFELFIINDASTDNTSQVLKNLRKSYPFTLIKNRKNKGKTQSLNEVIPRTRGEFIFIIDSDVLLNKIALEDMLARLEDSSVGAVSCRYAALNKGLFPMIQDVDYNFLTLYQGSYNIISTLQLNGACMMIKRNIFEIVGGFTPNALTEDVELALKIIEKGWRVEQSFKKVYTIVPETLHGWSKQRIRWGAGFIQSFLSHTKVYFKNPIFFFFFTTFIFLVFSGFFIPESKEKGILASLSLDSNFLEALSLLLNDSDLLRRILFSLLIYPLFSLIYVFPLIRKLRDLPKLFLVYPFAFIYLPLLSLVYTFAFSKGIYKYFALRENEAGWKGE